ncbi:MAG: DMT family transporter [Oscillospiraceae bacterium]|nr:DMT family transporter [Oscillospiraceae bacterium]
MTRQQKADLWLLLITFFWGSSYYLTDVCLRELPPMWLNAFRFLLSFALLGCVFHKRLRRVNRATLRGALLVGAALVGTYVFYGYGVSRTSLSNAGFISALAVVFTPLFDFLFRGRKPQRKLFAALALCTLGLGLLTLGRDFRPQPGDILCLGVSLCYTADLMLTEETVKNETVDPVAMGVLELGVVGVVMLCLSLALETPVLPRSGAVWGAALFLGLLCTGVAFVVQTVQQQYTAASHVGLIFTLEPVFSAVIAYFFAGERLRPQGYLGAALMLASLVLMEVDIPLKKRRADP